MFDPTTLVGFHTWLSLIALVSGIVAVVSLARGRDRPGMAAVFLLTAIATSATGYLFPFNGLLPSHIVGAASLAALAVAAVARYGFHLAGGWRTAYVVGFAAGVWLDLFVAIAQAFLKVPALKAIAPTGTEAPFALAQGAGFLVAAALVALAIRSGRAKAPAAAFA